MIKKLYHYPHIAGSMLKTNQEITTFLWMKLELQIFCNRRHFTLIMSLFNCDVQGRFAFKCFLEINRLILRS